MNRIFDESCAVRLHSMHLCVSIQSSALANAAEAKLRQPRGIVLDLSETRMRQHKVWTLSYYLWLDNNDHILRGKIDIVLHEIVTTQLIFETYTA